MSESLEKELREEGAYSVLWDVALWMETDLAESWVAKHRPDVAQRMKDGALKVKQAAQDLLF